MAKKLRIESNKISTADDQLSAVGVPIIEVDLTTEYISSMRVNERVIPNSSIDYQEVIVYGLDAIAQNPATDQVNVGSGMLKAVNTAKFSPGLPNLPVTPATSGKEKLAIVQVDNMGSISVKYGTEIDFGLHNAQYPAKDNNNLMIAGLFQPTDPIDEYFTVINNSDIWNEYGDRLVWNDITY